eukprot:911533-Rhodomonas_salina.3
MASWCQDESMENAPAEEQKARKQAERLSAAGRLNQEAEVACKSRRTSIVEGVCCWDVQY